MGRGNNTYNWSRFRIVNCRPIASNYQLSHLRMGWDSNFDFRGGKQECYNSVTVAPISTSKSFFDLDLFFYLFIWDLHHFQHCTGHITMVSWKGRGNQYIEFVRVLYCKLPTNGKQLPAFPLEAMPEEGGKSVTKVKVKSDHIRRFLTHDFV